jgi:carbamoyl-phosphate synthase large subunit
MKSVGEAMSLGRNFTEALNKAMRSLETKAGGFWTLPDPAGATKENTLAALRMPHDGRLYTVERALRLGASIAEVTAASGGIDPWFLDQIAALVELRAEIVDAPVLDGDLLRRAKRAGLSDRQLAALRPELAAEDGVRTLRHRLDIRPVYKTVDTCAAEFEATTPYHYSSYDSETEVVGSDRPKVLILGSGPNRIGQGIEFDYSCVHAVQALRGAPTGGAAGTGYETVMVNCNPETVSTDYDTADRLYFEPLTFEDVLEVWHAEDTSGKAAGGPGVVGVIVQLGGQTPLGLAQRLKDAGVPVVGTSPESIHLAEERGAFGAVLARAGLRAPAHGMATSYDEAKAIADEIGYPVLVRPSYVLGGRGMEIVYDDATLRDYIGRATDISPDHPVLVDRFLDDAIEIDVDALCDADGEVYLGGVMEHIEEAGIHSGDSSCSLPPITLAGSHVAQVRRYTEAIARGIGVRGLLNVQYALKDDVLYVLEANPRASRTVPFVSKATAVPLAKAAARIALGATIAELRAEGLLPATGDGGSLPAGAPIAVKEAVLPFKRFRTPTGKGVDSLLGPEMKSTGEVMGIDTAFGHAFAKSQSAAYGSLPTSGKIFVSVANRDKRGMIFPIKRLADLGFEIVATTGTAEVLRRHGIACEQIRKHYESGAGEDAVSLILGGDVALVINTPQGSGASARSDGYEIRSAAVTADIPCITTVPGAAAAVMGIEARIRGDMKVRPLQELHAALRAAE